MFSHKDAKLERASDVPRRLGRLVQPENSVWVQTGDIQHEWGEMLRRERRGMKKRQKEERAAEGGREGEACGGRRGGQGHAEEGGGHGT